MIKRKIHFFAIETLKRDIENTPTIFEDICNEIMELSPAERTLDLTGGTFVRLSYFQRQHDHFQGKIVKYRSNHMITGMVSDDELTDFTLGEGKRFTEVTHFVYSPDTHIMSIEYNQNGPRHSMFLRYINSIQATYKTDRVSFLADLLMHPDVVQKIRDANYIKTLTISIPTEKIPSNLDKNNFLKALSASAKIGNAGTVSISVSGSRGRGDKTPLMSSENLVSALETGYIELGIFGKVTAEVVNDFTSETVNLLENKLESVGELDAEITSETASRWFEEISTKYRQNKSTLLRSLRENVR